MVLSHPSLSLFGRRRLIPLQEKGSGTLCPGARKAPSPARPGRSSFRGGDRRRRAPGGSYPRPEEESPPEPGTLSGREAGRRVLRARAFPSRAPAGAAFKSQANSAQKGEGGEGGALCLACCPGSAILTRFISNKLPSSSGQQDT